MMSCSPACGSSTRRAFRSRWTTSSTGPRPTSVLGLAPIVKVDVLDGGIEHAAEQARLLRPFGVTLLAEKVEDRAMFEQCLELGYELFQGFFFCKPEIVTGREIPSSASCSLHDIAVLTRADATFEEIEAIVSRDPGLTLAPPAPAQLGRLLIAPAHHLGPRRGDDARSAHRPAVGDDARAQRHHHALRRAGADRPEPRADARRCLAQRRDGDTDIAFSVGLLSVADAMLGVSMADALDGIPLHEAVIDALLHRAGPDGAALTAVIDYEWGFHPVGDAGHRATRSASATPRRWRGRCRPPPRRARSDALDTAGAAAR